MRVMLFILCAAVLAVADDSSNALSTFQLGAQSGAAAYDEALAVSCLQGVINRDAPRLFVLSSANARPKYWLDVMSEEGNWLAARTQTPAADLDALRDLAGECVKGAVIWDPNVPATVNVATTIAGVKDAVALSPELADQVLAKWNLPVLDDLRGKFDGSESGSAKNDAYRWAIREYLAKGLCSSKLICLFEDAAQCRDAGNISYVVTRDWAVKQRAFVFDLSPWGDEVPWDDRQQPLGTDIATYRMVLEETLKQSAGKHMTELTGFFAFWKYSNVGGNPSKHEPVPTEWETVWLISPYNCYQNTISSDCYNQSFHSQAPAARLTQRRPAQSMKLEAKAYVCILMADYDSATPLYDFLPNHWGDSGRGRIPLAWGINPNLIETYPDVIAHFYATATDNDFFTADASAAGYFNPNRIEAQYLPLMVEHNKRFFDRADMSIAPMVLDWAEPTAAVKDAFAQFAPDGFATIVMDMHGNGGTVPKPHVWKGMPVTELINNTCNFSNPKQTANAMYGAIKDRGVEAPGFYFFRIVWTPPSKVIESLDVFRADHPEVPIKVVDPFTFFALFREKYNSKPE
ncbi:MAG: hypothetical protein HUU46_05635 [Candidatus Hydrogenedentes bacterium]|nr:hypothetical protein [Candidatus Hydrogenedentota bacterium]